MICYLGRLTLPEFQNTGWPTEAIEVLAGSGLLQLLPPRLIRSMGLKVLFPVSKKELMSMSSTLVWLLPMSTLFLKRKEEQKIEKSGRQIRSFFISGLRFGGGPAACFLSMIRPRLWPTSSRIRVNGGDGTCFEPVQRVGCDPEAGQSGGLSNPRWMSHLASNRHHHLPGERRPAGARTADGWS